MTSPLYDHLVEKSRRNDARFHMPGHKGVSVLGVAPEAIDFTELSDTGDLYAPQHDIISTAEALAADDYSAVGCAFSAGGATLCIQAAMAAVVSFSAKTSQTPRFLAARDAHRSFFHALALLDATADYLPTGSPADAYRDALTTGEYCAVYLTSPNYYGILADTDGIYDVCKRAGVPLIVDGAHGAHLEWLGIKLRADYVVMSAHKTLQALGGAAMLHTYGDGDIEIARRFMKVFGTSSPSYLILASLDRALGLLRRHPDAMRETALRVDTLRRTLNLPQSTRHRTDPCRLSIPYADGTAAARQLETLGVFPEMADRRNVVFIITPADNQRSLDRLRDALQAVTIPLDTAPAIPETAPPPQAVMSPRAALFAKSETVPLDAAAGRIAAVPVAPYPPGVPIVAPGEKISTEHVAFLHSILYNEGIEVLLWSANEQQIICTDDYSV